MTKIILKVIINNHNASLEFSVPHTGNQTCSCLQCYGWFVLDHPPYRPHLTPSYNFFPHATLHALFRNILTTCQAQDLNCVSAAENNAQTLI